MGLICLTLQKDFALMKNLMKYGTGKKKKKKKKREGRRKKPPITLAKVLMDWIGKKLKKQKSS